MSSNIGSWVNGRALVLSLSGLTFCLGANAASCKTQSQISSAQRDVLSITAHSLMDKIQAGDVTSLQQNTIATVAADFSGVADTVDTLKPLVKQAVITIDGLYLLDASGDAASSGRMDFYCGSPLVVLDFNELPAGTYALVLLHATGVPEPQQISFMLSETGDRKWELAGVFSRPMIEAYHDGLWYWRSARKFAEKKLNWTAWFYYQTAVYLLQPVAFISSPNLQKLQQEGNQLRPIDIPGTEPLKLAGSGSVFQLTSIDTTAALGELDLDVHFTPDPLQANELKDPPTARKQVTAVMIALLKLHPELQEAFHGIWVHADGGTGSLFSLELPMGDITSQDSL